MPAEWEPHASTWLAWPHNADTWPGRLLKEVESVYLTMIKVLLGGEKVNLLVPSEKHKRSVIKKLHSTHAKMENLIFHRAPFVDSWIRDYGPIFVKQIPVIARTLRSGEAAKEGTKQSRRIQTALLRSTGLLRPFGARNDTIAFTKWRFNAWGGKYKDLARDNGVVDRIRALKKYHRFDAGIVLEGGSIDVNGRGTCLTTEQCLLTPTRNPKLSRQETENYLKRFLGIKKVIWLKDGIEGDDTDGHVDDLARFVNPTIVLAAVEPDNLDKNHFVLKENLEILRRGRDQDGRKLRVIELPMPGRVCPGRDGGVRLPASYANFYIANRCVLVPVYDHWNDRKALGILRRFFPDRKVVGIDCTALVYGLGAIHCVTQQEPV